LLLHVLFELFQGRFHLELFVADLLDFDVGSLGRFELLLELFLLLLKLDLHFLSHLFEPVLSLALFRRRRHCEDRVQGKIINRPRRHVLFAKLV